jgi:hypothetical protein
MSNPSGSTTESSTAAPTSAASTSSSSPPVLVFQNALPSHLITSLQQLPHVENKEELSYWWPLQKSAASSTPLQSPRVCLHLPFRCASNRILMGFPHSIVNGGIDY